MPKSRKRSPLRSVLVANHKGGAGKTTGAFHLAWMLRDMGMKVLVIDTDPQGNLHRRFSGATYQLDERPVIEWSAGCACIYSPAEVELPVGTSFDIAIVDSPPSHSLPTGFVPAAVIVPIDSLDAALGAVDIIGSTFGSERPNFVVVKNGTNEGGKDLQRTVTDLQECDGVEVCPIEIPRGNAIKRTDKTCRPAWCDVYRSSDAKSIKSAYAWVAERVLL